jgi:hypothetical protein
VGASESSSATIISSGVGETNSMCAVGWYWTKRSIDSIETSLRHVGASASLVRVNHSYESPHADATGIDFRAQLRPRNRVAIVFVLFRREDLAARLAVALTEKTVVEDGHDEAGVAEAFREVR